MEYVTSTCKIVVCNVDKDDTGLAVLTITHIPSNLVLLERLLLADQEWKTVFTKCPLPIPVESDAHAIRFLWNLRIQYALPFFPHFPGVTVDGQSYVSPRTHVVYTFDHNHPREHVMVHGRPISLGHVTGTLADYREEEGEEKVTQDVISCLLPDDSSTCRAFIMVNDDDHHSRVLVYVPFQRFPFRWLDGAALGHLERVRDLLLAHRPLVEADPDDWVRLMPRELQPQCGAPIHWQHDLLAEAFSTTDLLPEQVPRHTLRHTPPTVSMPPAQTHYPWPYADDKEEMHVTLYTFLRSRGEMVGTHYNVYIKKRDDDDDDTLWQVTLQTLEPQEKRYQVEAHNIQLDVQAVDSHTLRFEAHPRLLLTAKMLAAASAPPPFDRAFYAGKEWK